MNKNKIKILFLFLCAVAVSGCNPEPSISPSSHKGSVSLWHSFRGNAPGNTGVADESVSPPFGLLWKIKVNGEFRSSPAVDAERVYIGSTDGTLYAFDRNDGKIVWTFKAGGILAPPVIDGGIIYIGAGDKKFYSIDAKTGQPTQRPFEAKGIINGAAAVTKDLVIFGAYDKYVYALPKDDFAHIAWLKLTGDWIDSTPTVSGDSVYVGSNDGNLYKMKLVDGEIDWRYQTGGPLYSTPLVSGNIIYFTSWDGNVYSVDSTGSLKWKTKVDEQVSASLALYRGKLYGGGMFNGPFFMLDAADGKLLNSSKTFGGFDASPVVSGDTIYAGSFDDNVYGVSAADLSVKWIRKMRAHVRSTCAVANNTLFVADMQGRLFAFAPLK